MLKNRVRIGSAIDKKLYEQLKYLSIAEPILTLFFNI